MLCQRCKKREATYHSKTIINGMVSEEHLCSNCAKHIKPIDFDNFDNFKLLDVFDDIPFVNNTQYEYDLLPSNFLDNAFNFYDCRRENTDILTDALKSIKKGAKDYESNKDKIDPNLNKLKRELKSAVDNEDYEKAVELKKEIEKIIHKDNKNSKDNKENKNNKDKKGE